MASAAAEAGLRLGPQRVLFVGGKGGVGKTTTASALALRLAERGERCLLVSTDPAHSLGDLWGRRIGHEEVELTSRLRALEIDPDAQLESYLDRVKENVRDVADPDLRAEVERQISLARSAPGAAESALLERVADMVADPDPRFDRIIFDTAPTGHTLRLLSLPEVMAAWTDGLLRQRDRSESWNAALRRFGPRPGVGDDVNFLDAVSEPEDERSARIRAVLLERRRKFYRARRVLLDPGTTAFILVLVPEKLPIEESRKTVDALAEFRIPVLALVVNRVLPSGDLGEFLEMRREREERYLASIERHFPRIPKLRVPLMPRDVEDVDAIRRIGSILLP